MRYHVVIYVAPAIYKSAAVSGKIFSILQSERRTAADESERERGLHFSWYPRCCLMLRQHFNAGLTDAAFRTPPARLENVPGTVWSLCLTQNPPQNKIHMLFLLFLIVYMLNYFFQSWEKGSRWTLDVAERHVPVMLHRRWMGYWLCVLKRQL